MKQYIALVLVLALCLSMAGCTASGPNNAPEPPAESPSSDIGCIMPPESDYDWGITLTLENLTPTGATIVCTQSGGTPTGELDTGSYFILEQLTESGWVEVEQRKLEGDLVWTAEAYIVNMNGTTKWNLSWEWLYGELPSGHYRVGKEFMDFRGPGDYDTMMVYTEFSFGEMPIAE